jgi:hypothetical protein
VYHIECFRNGDGWEEGYYDYDYEAEGWYQDEHGEWQQVELEFLKNKFTA